MVTETLRGLYDDISGRNKSTFPEVQPLFTNSSGHTKTIEETSDRIPPKDTTKLKPEATTYKVLPTSVFKVSKQPKLIVLPSKHSSSTTTVSGPSSSPLNDATQQ